MLIMLIYLSLCNINILHYYNFCSIDNISGIVRIYYTDKSCTKYAD